MGALCSPRHDLGGKSRHAAPGSRMRRPQRGQLLRDLWIDGHKGHAEFVIPDPTDCGRLNDQPPAGVVRIDTEFDIRTRERRREAPNAASAWGEIANRTLPDDNPLVRGETRSKLGTESLMLTQIQGKHLPIAKST